MKISIKTPCHENWNDMKPNENGAFCLSCQKSVIDFTNKSVHEIKSFFKSITETEKVCGRFKKEQLTELSFDDFFERFKKWGLPQRIAIVIFFVFGLTLFSCQSSENTTVTTNSSLEIPLEKDSTRAIQTTDTTKIKNKNHTTPIEKEKLEMLGDVAFVPPATKTATFQSIETDILGKVATASPITKTTTLQFKETDIEPMGDVDFSLEELNGIKKTHCTPKDTTSKIIHESRIIKGDIKR